MANSRFKNGGPTRGRNPVKRMAMLHEAEELLLDELPILPIYWYVHSYMLKPSVKNWLPSLLEHRCYKAVDLVPTP